MSHQDNEKNKRLRETIESLPAMTRDTAERARELLANMFGMSVERLGREFPMKDVEADVAKIVESYTQIQAEAREQLAAWMIEHSFSTGHGDTFEDLLKELDWQVKELRGQQRALLTEQDVTEAYQSAPNWRSVLSSLNYRAIKNAALAQALQLEEKEGT